MAIKVFLNINDSRWKKYKIDFSTIISKSLQAVNKKSGEVSVVLTNDSEIRKLNKRYRGIDRATNVLSFETGDKDLLGDIFISFDTVMNEAGQSEFKNHTIHLIVHGVLHLVGFDHMNDSDAIKMESKEIKILKTMGIKNPYQQSNDKNKKFKNIIYSAILGAIASLGFAPYNLWFLTLIGIGGAYYITNHYEKIDNKTRILSAIKFGGIYSLAMFWWMTHSIYVVPELTKQFAILTVPSLIGITIVGAPFLGLTFCIPRLIGVSGWKRPLFFAGAWILFEWLREWLFTGFPWNPLANITMPLPVLANSMSFWGSLGLSFVISGFIASIIFLISDRNTIKKDSQKYNKYIPITLFSILIAIGLFFGHENIQRSSVKNEVSEVIRIVQPALTQSEKGSQSRESMRANAKENYNQLIDLAKIKSEISPDVIVFPETAYPYVVLHGEKELPMAKILGRQVILGSMTYDNGKFYNSMVIADASGKLEKIYSKSHLVPFGEYRPFGDLIPTPGMLTAGNGPEVIGITQSENMPLNFAPAICYEIIFTDSLLPKNYNYIDSIINLTNDTWFGKTPGTYQHLDMVRRYAIESGLPIVRANYSGVSAFIGADGKIISSLPVGKSGILDGVVWGAHETVYRHIGRDGIILIILSVLGLIFVTMKVRKRV